MTDIPLPYVKVNQAGIVLFILLATFFNMPYLLVLLWVIQLSGAIFGTNLFVQITKQFIPINGAKKQPIKMQKFNSGIVILFLSISVFSFADHLPFIGYTSAWILGLVSFIAFCGYCLGCEVYSRYESFKGKRKTKY